MAGTATAMEDDFSAYRKKMEAELTDRVINTDVSDERRSAIMRKPGYNGNGVAPQTSIRRMQNEASTIEQAVEQMAYTGKSVPMQIALYLAFRTRLLRPYQILARDRNLLEEAIASERADISDLMSRAGELDKKNAEKRSWAIDAKHVYEDLKAKKDQHEAEMAQEAAESENCKKTFYNSQDQAEKEKAKQMFQGYQQMRQVHEKSIKELDREMNSTIISFNRFCDDLEDLKYDKDIIEEQTEGLEADASEMEDYSRRLAPFTEPTGNLMGQLGKMAANQEFIRSRIKPLVDGLDALYERHRGIVRKIADVYRNRRKERRTRVREEITGSNERLQEERKLALERMEKLDLL